MTMKSACLFLLSCVLLFSGVVRAGTVFPRLAQQQQAQVKEILVMLDEVASEAAEEQTEHPAEQAEMVQMSRAAQHMRQLIQALTDNDLALASRLLPELERLLAVTDQDDELWTLAAQLLMCALSSDLLLSDASIDWIATQIHRSDTSEHREYVLHMGVLQAGRALREGQIARSRHILQTLVDEARNACAAAADGNPQGAACHWLTDDGLETSLIDSLSLLDEPGLAALSGAEAVVKLSAWPMHVDSLQLRKCGYGQLLGAQAGQVDAINLAVGTGHLDAAIALAMHHQVLAPHSHIDRRLPDLLLARYGQTAVDQEFEAAAMRIEQTESINGTIVSTRLFGRQLQLPSSAELDGVRIEYQTISQHQDNLQSSALYQAMYPEEQE